MKECNLYYLKNRKRNTKPGCSVLNEYMITQSAEIKYTKVVARCRL